MDDGANNLPHVSNRYTSCVHIFASLMQEIEDRVSRGMYWETIWCGKFPDHFSTNVHYMHP